MRMSEVERTPRPSDNKVTPTGTPISIAAPHAVSAIPIWKLIKG
jgi:hypothetical protein